MSAARHIHPRDLTSSERRADRQRAELAVVRKLKRTEIVHHHTRRQLVVCEDAAYHRLIHMNYDCRLLRAVLVKLGCNRETVEAFSALSRSGADRATMDAAERKMLDEAKRR